MCPLNTAPIVFNCSEAELIRLGESLSELSLKDLQTQSQSKLFFRLDGDVGAGKTTFARAFITKWHQLQDLPLKGPVTSPTYPIVQCYPGPFPLAHLDLYRIKSRDEMEAIGFESYFYEQAVTLVEWFQNLENEMSECLPADTIQIVLSGISPEKRTVSIYQLPAHWLSGLKSGANKQNL